jgi:limonene 1,2-monooxygenase
MLSIGATTAAGFDALAHHWGIAEEQAKVSGKTIDRSQWRLVGMCHIAESKERAYDNVAYGIEHYFHYMQKVAAVPQFELPGSNIKEMVDHVNGSGLGAIGTPEMCIAQIDRLMKQSNGGFGAYLLLAHNWANPEATRKSYELIARHVMPHFQGHYQPMIDAASRAAKARPDLAARHAKAVEEMQARHDAEVAARSR